MNKTIAILAGSTFVLIGGIALAQGKPADKPGAAPAAAGAKPAAAPAAAGAKPAAAPGAKPAEPGKPGAGPAAAAAGPAPAAPPPPKPPAELDEGFKYFTGNWKCDTKMPAGAMGPGSPEV